MKKTFLLNGKCLCNVKLSKIPFEVPKSFKRFLKKLQCVKQKKGKDEIFNFLKKESNSKTFALVILMLLSLKCYEHKFLKDQFAGLRKLTQYFLNRFLLGFIFIFKIMPHV